MIVNVYLLFSDWREINTLQYYIHITDSKILMLYEQLNGSYQANTSLILYLLHYLPI